MQSAGEVLDASDGGDAGRAKAPGTMQLTMKIRRFNPESACDPFYVFKADISFLPFDRADVRSVNASAISEFLLRQSRPQTQTADVGREDSD